jgi:hypothetical protein
MFARDEKYDLERITVRDWESDQKMIEDPSNDDRYFTHVLSHPDSDADMYLTESHVFPTKAERREFPREEE